MRIRTIKPEFFLNERLADLSPLHRLFFIGLWCEADREGRGEARPKRLRAQILPYEDVEVDHLLIDLAKAGFIILYEHEGRRYFEIPGFAKHQRPNHREAASEIPDSYNALSTILHGHAHAFPGHAGENPGTPSFSPARSSGREGKGKERKENTPPPPFPGHAGENLGTPGNNQVLAGQGQPSVFFQVLEEPKTEEPQQRVALAVLEGDRRRNPRFDFEREVYALYPRRGEGKTRGLRMCKAKIRTVEQFERLKRAVRVFAARVQRNGTERNFVPHFSTWMGHQWEDYADGDPDEAAGAITSRAPKPPPNRPPLVSDEPLPKPPELTEVEQQLAAEALAALKAQILSQKEPAEPENTKPAVGHDA